MPLNLDEVPTIDLVQEICRRNDATVLAMTKGEDWNHVLDGNGILCTGLVQYLEREVLLANMNENS